MAKNDNYSAKDISVLEGLEAVRKRPGMYIGTTGIDGLYHLIWEAFDNSRDEAMGGHANEIEITLLKDDKVRVSDNGRGIPVDIHPKTKISALETIMTTLHAGGKFGGDGYSVSGGLHGVGVSVLNALSESAEVYVHRDGDIHYQAYSSGKRDKVVKKVGKTKETGTVVIFKADKSIFNSIKFDGTVFEVERIISHTRDQAYLVKSLLIRIIDARDDDINNEHLFVNNQTEGSKKYSFFYDGGLKSFVRHHNNTQRPVQSQIFYSNKQVGDVNVEIAFQYVDDISSRLFAFGNTIRNPEGGTHVTGFKGALTKTINSYAKTNKLVKEGDTFTGDDVLEGLTAVVSVKLPEIQFEGQTKSKLGSIEARSAVETVLNSELRVFFDENPSIAKTIVSKVNLALMARKAARIAKDSVLRKGALDSSTLPGKLTDCQVKNADEAELFIVEGDSAGGTAKLGRDRRTQAILPIKGKILNVEKARIDRALASEEIKTIVIALGTAIGDTFDLSKLRYGKIIIATDADVDGAHIRTLLLTLFYRYFQDLITNGNIYFAVPPLYKLKKGRAVEYVFSEEDKGKLMKKLGGEGITVQRYKGLGEMNYDELRDTTMSKENRILKRVTIEDSEAANKVFDILMGGEVGPRRAFIKENATYADIDA